jgi:hypothetical protein
LFRSATQSATSREKLVALAQRTHGRLAVINTASAALTASAVEAEHVFRYRVPDNLVELWFLNEAFACPERLDDLWVFIDASYALSDRGKHRSTYEPVSSPNNGIRIVKYST